MVKEILDRVRYGLYSWFLPRPGKIRGKVTEKEKEECLHVSFFTYICIFAILQSLFKGTVFGINAAPVISAFLGFLVYLSLYLYRYGQGISSVNHRNRILVVEDDKDSAVILIKLLKNNWDVVWVDTAESAIVRLQDDYNWVILDLMLPGENGETILQHIKINRIKVKTIVLTAMSGGPTLEEAKLLNPTAIVYKPFEAGSIMDILKEIDNGVKG